MNIRRSPLIVAAALSLMGHGAVVMALTPAHDERQQEAGSGAGSVVAGSIDAIVGMAMPIDQIISADEASTTTSELPPADTPTEIQTAALAPEIPAADVPPPSPSAEISPVQPAETPTEIAAVSPSMVEPTETAPVETETKVVTPAETSPIEQADVAAASPLEETQAAPIDGDLAAASPTELDSAEPTPPASIADAASETVAVQEPAKTAELASAKSTEIAAALPPPTEVKAIEEQPVEKPPEARKVAKPARPKADKQDRQERQATTPAAGNADANSRKGAATATENATAQDQGAGRSNEAGNGWFDKSNYNGRVYSRLKRMIRYPGEAQRRQVGGTARVAFTIGANGQLGGLRLLASSGDSSLDAAALDTVRRAAPFPPLPRNSGLNSLAISVPLRFNPRR